MLTNKQIAEKVADIVYKPKKNEQDPDFAVQILVEKLCIPNDVKSYTKEDVVKMILWQLNFADELENEWMERKTNESQDY